MMWIHDWDPSAAITLDPVAAVAATIPSHPRDLAQRDMGLLVTSTSLAIQAKPATTQTPPGPNSGSSNGGAPNGGTLGINGGAPAANPTRVVDLVAKAASATRILRSVCACSEPDAITGQFVTLTEELLSIDLQGDPDRADRGGPDRAARTKYLLVVLPILLNEGANPLSSTRRNIFDLAFNLLHQDLLLTLVRHSNREYVSQIMNRLVEELVLVNQSNAPDSKRRALVIAAVLDVALENGADYYDIDDQEQKDMFEFAADGIRTARSPTQKFNKAVEYATMAVRKLQCDKSGDLRGVRPDNNGPSGGAALKTKDGAVVYPYGP